MVKTQKKVKKYGRKIKQECFFNSTKIANRGLKLLEKKLNIKYNNCFYVVMVVKSVEPVLETKLDYKNMLKVYYTQRSTDEKNEESFIFSGLFAIYLKKFTFTDQAADGQKHFEAITLS